MVNLESVSIKIAFKNSDATKFFWKYINWNNSSPVQLHTSNVKVSPSGRKKMKPVGNLVIYSGFFTVALLTFETENSLLWRISVDYRRLCSIPGLYPLDVNNTPPSPGVTTKVSTYYQLSPGGGKIAQVENYWSTPKT